MFEFRFSDLRPNLVCGSRDWRSERGNMALCGVKSTDLTQQTIRILGIHFSYNINLRDELNFTNTVKKIESLLNVWCQRGLTLEGKITIFKTLAISQVVYIEYLSSVPVFVVKELNKNQNHFLFFMVRELNSNMKPLCNTFKNGCLQSVDIEIKIKALQLSWIDQLFDQKEHQWKTIPQFLLVKNYGDTNVFYHHFAPTTEALKSFPIFYQQILTSWKDCSSDPIMAYAILNQRIWHNHFF
jgi:hypothetical protein